jgi:hypothetical protein
LWERREGGGRFEVRGRWRLGEENGRGKKSSEEGNGWEEGEGKEVDFTAVDLIDTLQNLSNEFVLRK